MKRVLLSIFALACLASFGFAADTCTCEKTDLTCRNSCMKKLAKNAKCDAKTKAAAVKADSKKAVSDAKAKNSQAKADAKLL